MSVDLEAVKRQLATAEENRYTDLYNGVWAFAREAIPALIEEIERLTQLANAVERSLPMLERLYSCSIHLTSDEAFAIVHVIAAHYDYKPKMISAVVAPPEKK